MKPPKWLLLSLPLISLLIFILYWWPPCALTSTAAEEEDDGKSLHISFNSQEAADKFFGKEADRNEDELRQYNLSEDHERLPKVPVKGVRVCVCLIVVCSAYCPQRFDTV